MAGFFDSAYLWAAFSSFCSFALTYWLLKNPATFLVLLALFIAVWVLFGPFGAVGFLVAAGVRLAQGKARQSEKSGKKRNKK